jgi:hypothetical protein
LFTLSHMCLNTTMTRGPRTSDSQGAPMQPRPAAQSDSAPGARPLRTPAAPIHMTDPGSGALQCISCNGASTVVCPCWLCALAVWCPTTQARFGKEDAHTVDEPGEAIFLGSLVLICSRERRSRKEGCKVEPFGTVWLLQRQALLNSV